MSDRPKTADDWRASMRLAHQVGMSLADYVAVWVDDLPDTDHLDLDQVKAATVEFWEEAWEETVGDDR